jgi:hypothetical protein
MALAQAEQLGHVADEKVDAENTLKFGHPARRLEDSPAASRRDR